MIVRGPEQLNQPMACAIHRFPLEAVVASTRQHNDDFRTVVFAQSSGQRIDQASGCQILVLYIDGLACSGNGRKIERLHLPNLTATVQLRPGPRDSNVDVAQSRFQFAGPGGVLGVNRRQPLVRRALPPSSR